MKLKYPIIALFLFVLIGCKEINKKTAIIDFAEAYDNGNFEGAKEMIETYLLKNDTNEFAWTLLGHVNKELNNDSLAKFDYNKALKINANTVEAITGLGIISRIEGNYQKAADYYNKAIEIDPSYAQAYASLVVINIKNKDFGEAVKVGLKGYKLDRSDPIIVANLAVAFHYDGDTLNRDKYLEIAKELGYQRIEELKKIFNNETTILD